MRLIRIIAVTTGWALLALLVVFLLWFLLNRTLDEKPDPSRKALELAAPERIPPSKNIAVGILGLSAPPGSNSMEYGAHIMALYHIGTWAQVQEAQSGRGTLHPTVDSWSVTCWLDPDMPPMKGCLPFSRASEVLAQNAELLRRYSALADLDALQTDVNYYNDAFLTAAKLNIAAIHLDMRAGRYESAYAKWRSQMVFARKSLSGIDTWVGKAIQLVQFGMVDTTLEELLSKSPSLARKHKAELLELLTPADMSTFNTDGITRAEYLFMEHWLDGQYVAPHLSEEAFYWLAHHLGQRSRMLNRLATFSTAYAEALRMPWPGMKARSEALWAEYADSVSGWDLTVDPFGTLLVSLHIRSALKAKEILKQMYVVDGKMRLASQLVRIISERVPDQSVRQYLEKSEPNLRNPFTGEPMLWDIKNRRIYFRDISDDCSIVYVRVPTSDGRSVARSNPRIC